MERVRRTPLARRHADDATKQAGEVCLIYKSALECDLIEWRSSRAHQFLRTIDATTNDVLVRRVAGAVVKGTTEVRAAQPSDVGELAVADRPVEIALDVGQDATGFPQWQRWMVHGFSMPRRAPEVVLRGVQRCKLLQGRGCETRVADL